MTERRIRTIIVDDELPARKRISKILKSFDNLILVGEAQNGLEAIKLIKEKSPELVLLDIQLKDMTGFEVLSKVRDQFSGDIIFITAYDQYAIKAFEENAIDYLLKPFTETRFQEAIMRVGAGRKSIDLSSLEPLIDMFRIQGRSRKLLRIPEGKTEHYFNAEDLLYIKADRYYSLFQMINNSKLIRISLKSSSSLLPSYFKRINRSVIINKNKILWTKRLKKVMEIEMIDGTRFTSSSGFEELNVNNIK